jgi:hypothetical protein
MFEVRWEETALNDLTMQWMESNSPVRKAITAAAEQIDQELQEDPSGWENLARTGVGFTMSHRSACSSASNRMSRRSRYFTCGEFGNGGSKGK